MYVEEVATFARFTDTIVFPVPPLPLSTAIFISVGPVAMISFVDGVQFK